MSEQIEIDTHNKIINFGKHQGEPWTRVPVSYLKWLANDGSGERKEYAIAELKRRGTTTPKNLELTGHAIDRASQITKRWEKKGVFSWLQEIGERALRKAGGQEKVVCFGFKFVFAYGDYYPTLKTIIKKD